MQSIAEEDEETQPSGSSFPGTNTKSTIKQVVHHVQEYHWKVDVEWEVSIYSGSDVDSKTTLKSRASSMVLVIQSDERAPLPEHRECRPLDLSLTWLIERIDPETMTLNFGVERHAPTTRTPRQNQQVEFVLIMMDALLKWTSGFQSYFYRCIQIDILDQHDPASSISAFHPLNRLTSLSIGDIFIPVQPLMETSKPTNDTSETVPKSVQSLGSTATKHDGVSQAASPLLSIKDVKKFLNEQICSIEEHIKVLQKVYPSPTSSTILSVLEVSMVHLSVHSEKLIQAFTSAVDYVEFMLRNQLIAAVGKCVQSCDIDQFLRYHNSKLLNPPPKSFCHAIRQSGHDPCGLLSIESVEIDGKKMPIETLSREVESSTPINLPLNATTNVKLTGKKYLHGWIQHRFGMDQKSYELTARARQFCSFLLVVGTMTAADVLDPKDAIIVQDKDVLLIPLLLRDVPTSMELKGAIRSLSPEQQRFVETFRQQLGTGTSVLGICVIQIKPQLEVLLQLPQDSLQKEIKLTQDLMELFIEYQVPSDRLSYDGTDAMVSPNEMVDNVRRHSKAIFDIIGEAKKQQLDKEWINEDMEFETWFAKVIDKWGETTRIPQDDDFCGVSLMDQDTSGEKIVPQELLESVSQSESMKDKFLFWCEEVSWSSKRTTDEGSIGNLESSLLLPLHASIPATQDDRSNSQISASTILEKQSQNTRKMVDAKIVGNADFTRIPKMLNSVIEKSSSGSSLRSTTIKLSNTWQRSRQENLLSTPKTTFLESDDSIKMERNKAYDLLDALSRNGSLQIASSELHVIVAVTHCFEKDVMNSIVQDNINPIEKLEMSTLLVGSVIYGRPSCS